MFRALQRNYDFLPTWSCARSAILEQGGITPALTIPLTEATEVAPCTAEERIYLNKGAPIAFSGTGVSKFIEIGYETYTDAGLNPEEDPNFGEDGD